LILNKLYNGTRIALEIVLIRRGYQMSIYTKSSSAPKQKPKEESPRYEREESHSAKIIPRPDVNKPIEKEKKRKTIHLEQKFIYYKGKKIPILQFQKSGYEKLLKLLVKGIEW